MLLGHINYLHSLNYLKICWVGCSCNRRTLNRYAPNRTRPTNCIIIYLFRADTANTIYSSSLISS